MTVDYEVNEIAAAAVRRHRERLGMSQSELARRMAELDMSWHQMTVARTESGDRPLRLDEALALANIFHVPLENLLRRVDDNIQREYQTISELLARLTREARLTQAQLDDARERYKEATSEFARVRARANAMVNEAAIAVGDAENEITEREKQLRELVSLIDRHHALLRDLQDHYPDVVKEVAQQAKKDT